MQDILFIVLLAKKKNDIKYITWYKCFWIR